MADVVTWHTDGLEDLVLTIPQEAMDALEQWRLADRVIVDAVYESGSPFTGQTYQTTQPRYATIRDMVMWFYINNLIFPALNRYPPSNLQQLQSDLAYAIQTTIASMVPGGV